MKMIRKASLVVIVAMFSVGIFAQQAKFGHMNSAIIISLMPEYADMQGQLAKRDSMYMLELERIAVEINKKIEDYNNDAAASDLLKEVKAQEIQELQVRAQNFQARADQDLKDLERQLLAPINNKLITTINEVAEANELLYVFDMAAGNPVYTSDKSLDLVPLILEKFGIDYDPTAFGL